MPQYKVLVDFELEGVMNEAGDELELAEEVAAPLFAEGKLELIGDRGDGDQAGADNAVA